MSTYTTTLTPQQIALNIMAQVSLGQKSLNPGTIHRLRTMLPKLKEAQRDDVEVFLQEEEETRTWGTSLH